MLTAMLKSRSTGEAGELINSSDIPDGTKTVNIVVAAIRESPEEFNAPAIIDFEKPIFGKSSWAVNKTNMKMLIKLFGDDETKLVGKKNKTGGDQGTQPPDRRVRAEPGCHKTLTVITKSASWLRVARCCHPVAGG